MNRKLLLEQLERRDLLAVLLDVDFSDGIPADWTVETEGHGRVQVVEGALRADSDRNGYWGRTHAIFPVPDSTDRLTLSFDHRIGKDETTRSDRVFARIGNGEWQEIADYVEGRNSVEITGYTEVDLRWYDNYSFPWDGREWDNVLVETIEPPTAQVVSTDAPLVESFDVLPDSSMGWEYISTSGGRIQTVNGRLRMDSRDRGGYDTNAAILHVDLQGQSSVYLTGQHWDLNDEEHQQDGIFLSPYGVNWTRHEVTQGRFEIALPSDTRQIKFQQYDNWPANSDGREYDNLRIEVRDYSQPLDAWPQDLGFAYDLLLDGGAYLSSKGTYAADALGLTYQTVFTSSTWYQNSIMVSSAHDTNGALVFPDEQNRVRGYYMNGGASGSHVVSLMQSTTPDGRNGKDLVQQFFASGGASMGSCAGAFAAGVHPRYFDLIPNTRFDAVMPWGVSVDASFNAPGDKPFRDVMNRLGVDTTVYNIPTYGGPRYRPGLDSISGTDITPGLQYFGRNFGTRTGYGAPQIAAYKGPGTGQGVYLSGHPEYRSSGTNLGLMMAVYQFGLENSPVTPQVKASLTPGQIVTMDGPKEKIGDGQYHLFEITVQAGAPSLTVTLDGMSHNADLFVQTGGLANEKSYIASSVKPGTATDQIVIDTPTPGTYSVAVRGDRNTVPLNGATYSLSVA